MFQDAFKRFLVDNNVLQVAAAMTFGVATVAFIKAFVGDFFLPIVYLILTRMLQVRSKILDSLLRNKELHFSNFAAELITYILILVTGFMLIQYVFRRYLRGVISSHNNYVPSSNNKSSKETTQTVSNTMGDDGVIEQYGPHSRVVFFDSAVVV